MAKMSSDVFWVRYQQNVVAIPRRERVVAMNEMTWENIEERFKLLRLDPEKYLAHAQEFIRANPENPDGYYWRYQAYDSLDRYELALADLDKVLSLDPHSVVYHAKARVLSGLGRYAEALDNYNRAEALDPEGWAGAFGHLYRADCYARLGNEKAALEDCAALSDGHWTPGPHGTPAGNKQEVAYELRRVARQARKPRLV
jgi:tetratricopeptide (TPR) repeat protein